MKFTRQEYWSPPLGNLPALGIKPVSLASPALAGGFFTTSTTWEDRWQLPTKSITTGTSLAAQWLGLRFPIQGVQVGSLVREPPGQKTKT